MKRVFWFFLVFGIVLMTETGCGLLPSPEGNVFIQMTARYTDDASKTVIVIGGMVFSDFRGRGMRFPPGTYHLVAEDDDHWFFAAPTPLEFRSQIPGESPQEFLPGGLMLAKTWTRMVPAGAYIDTDDPTIKILRRRLGSEFLKSEGRYWTMSFQFEGVPFPKQGAK